jgi:phosphatidylglycerophosphatase A
MSARRGTSSGRGIDRSAQTGAQCCAARGPGGNATISSVNPPSPDPAGASASGARDGGTPGGPLRTLAIVLATAAGAGFAPLAPGTVGAAVGVALFAGIAGSGPIAVLAVAGVLLAVGVWAAGEAERAFGRHDDGRIVLDEVVGQLVALAPLAWLPVAQARAPLLLGAGFLAFRLFDIWKPGPVRWAERRFPGGLGVMLDDVVAGGLAGVCMAGVVVSPLGAGA